MTTLRKFGQSKPRPLPVIVLADISGSMSTEGKIDSLNQAIREMLHTFQDESDLRAEIHVAVITFGGGAKIHTPLQPASRLEWIDMNAGGGTPMGESMRLARELLEDKQQLERPYHAAIILVSDGQPTDEWRNQMNELISKGRGAKADRIAIAIGSDADQQMLKEFINHPEKQVLFAEDASQIRGKLQLATATISMRSRSINPNMVPSPSQTQSLFDEDPEFEDF